MMLNTQSRSSSLLIWLIIVAIVVRALWSFLGLAAPSDVASELMASDAAQVLGRNPILVAGLAGFGGLALATLFNGWRERAERRHTAERSERRMAAVLAREADALGDQINGAVRQGHGLKTRLAELSNPADSLLLSMSAMSVARLGPGAASAIQGVRRGVRRLLPSEESMEEGEARELAMRALAASHAAKGAARLLDIVAQKGTAIADGRRVMALTESEMASLLAAFEAQAMPARLVPAA